MSLSEWAGRVGVSKFTAYRWFWEGILPVPAEWVGRLILVNGGVAEREPARMVLYARVPPHGQRGDLGRQVAWLAGWAAGQGMAAAGVAAGAGPGMSGGVAGWPACWLMRRLRQWWWGIVIVWLVPGPGSSRWRCRRRGRSIAVVDAGGAGDDLIREMTGVLTSFCARPYGRRGPGTGRSGRSVAPGVLLAW